MSYYRSWKHTSLTFCCCCWGTGRHPILWQSGALMPDFDLGVSSMKNWGLFHPLISWAHSLLNSSFSFLYPGELYSSVGSESTGIATAKHTSGSAPIYNNHFFIFCSLPDHIHPLLAWTHACVLFICCQSLWSSQVLLILPPPPPLTAAPSSLRVMWTRLQNLQAGRHRYPSLFALHMPQWCLTNFLCSKISQICFLLLIGKTANLILS